MTRRLAAAALRCYPVAFRRRYGAEMAALLDERPATAATVLDLVRGALVAHARPPAQLEALVPAGERVRASMAGVLACWVAFAAAGLGFYKTTEDVPFSGAGDAHPALGLAHGAVQALAGLASVAVVVGALPLIAAALVRARRDPSLRPVVAVPIVAVLVFAALTGLLVAVARAAGDGSGPAGGAGRGALVAWSVAGLACGAVCVVGARRALFATPLARGPLLTALACATVVAATMVLLAAATAVYALALPIDAPGLSGSRTGRCSCSASARRWPCSSW